MTDMRIPRVPAERGLGALIGRVARATDNARGNSARLLRQTEDRMRTMVGSVKGFFKQGGPE